MVTRTTSESWRCTDVELDRLPPEISHYRRMECINALQGVRRPVAAVQSAKASLKSMIEKFEGAGWPKSETEKARRALAMLEGLE